MDPAAGSSNSLHQHTQVVPREVWIGNKPIEELTKRIQQSPQIKYTIRVDHKDVQFYQPRSGTEFIDAKVFKDLCDTLVSKSITMSEFEFFYMYSEHIDAFVQVLERCTIEKLSIGVMSNVSLDSLTKLFTALNKLCADIRFVVLVTRNDQLIRGDSYEYIQKQTQKSMLNPRFALEEINPGAPLEPD